MIRNKLPPLLIWIGLFRDKIYDLLDRKKPFLNKIRYCDYDLYYGSRSGIVNRIRFGHRDRIYERLLCESLVEDLAEENDRVFLDIGANVGLVSLYVMSKLPKCKIYAFEPGPKQYRVLDITIFANQLEKWMILSNRAISDKNGRIEFHAHKDEFESGGDGILDTKRGGETEVISVETVTLDSWWNSFGRPNIKVIKIDTEGAELLILRGAEEVMNTLKPFIYLEISLLNLKNYPYKAEDILSYLNGYNYGVKTLNGLLVTKENINQLALVEDSFVAKSN